MAGERWKGKRVALAHDYLNSWGGGERVLQLFKEKLFPDADVYSITYDPTKVAEHITFPVRTSALQKVPFATRFHKWFLVLMPWAVRSLPLTGYDLVLSDASGFIKGVQTQPETLHVCYLHTPTRYLTVDEWYFKETVPQWLHWLMPPFLNYLKKKDREDAKRPDVYIANSQETAKRLRTYYHREPAAIIFPPVDTERFFRKPEDTVEDYYLLIGRLAPYKRFDLAIEACNKLGKRLVVIGAGPEEEALKKIAGPTVEFWGKPSDEVLREAYAQCVAMLFPPLEDAGMTPLECMACGRPVIAYGKAGALESIVDGKTGLFFAEQTVEAVAAAITRFEERTWSEGEITQHAQQFSAERFIEQVAQEIDRAAEAKVTSDSA